MAVLIKDKNGAWQSAAGAGSLVKDPDVEQVKVAVTQLQTDLDALETKVNDDVANKLAELDDTINNVVAEKIASIVAGAPESFDTLKEIADWIATHQSDAATMNSAISTLNAKTAKLSADGSMYSGKATTAGTADTAKACSGNAASATKLATSRTIGGVSFDGTANINLPGVNKAGNQNTSGKAATAGTADVANKIRTSVPSSTASGDIWIN